MTRSKEFKDLPSVLNGVLKKYNLYENINSQQIIMHWEKIVGDKIAKQCKPVTFNEGELVIQAKTNIWKQELAQRQDDLLNLVNGRIKSSLVKKIKII